MMDSLAPQLQQFYLILKCLFPDLGCPLSGRGSSKPFLPACTCCSSPSCPSSPHRSAEPALWPLDTLQTQEHPTRSSWAQGCQAAHTYTSCCSSWSTWDPAFSESQPMSLSLPQTSRSSLENHFNELTKRETWKLDQKSCALETARSPSWL